MKGEYVEGNKNESNNMFAKLHHQPHNFQHPLHPHHHHQQQHQQQPPPHHQHHFQISRECQTSEEDDSRSSGGATAVAAGAAIPTPTKPKSGDGDGATIEVVRRPRGRPPGSKNKPKPPVIITRDTEPAMSPYVLEVPGGVDVVEAIARFSRRRNIGLCVLNGSGTVANVTLRQPSTTPGATVTFHGRFDILSISATIIPQSASSPIPSSANGFTISLAGPQGQIVGGAVAGTLLAAGTVYIIAASFNNPSYHRLPGEDEVNNSVSGGNEVQSPPTGSGDSGHPPAEMSIYSCHLPSDVIWAPTARQPPPPPY